MSTETRFKELLSRLSLEPYATPISTDDTLVVLARINAATQDEFKRVESRLLFFIEKLLQASAVEDKPYKVRLSRPFILKDGALRYTWDFTLKGDVASAVRDAERITLPKLTETREELVSTQMVKPSKGSVKPVTVGSIA